MAEKMNSLAKSQLAGVLPEGSAKRTISSDGQMGVFVEEHHGFQQPPHAFLGDEATDTP